MRIGSVVGATDGRKVKVVRMQPRVGALLHLIANSVEPIAGSPVQVRDSDNQNFRFQNLISDAMRKASRLAPAPVRSERMPSFGKMPHAFERTEHFKQELFAETRRFRVIVLDRLVKLLPSDVEETDFDLFAIFCEDFC